mmetsp:Transcript_24329/g.36081  ORF Transcript_24329/g.36081 Transcript_24329/m.36081 type:complete len:852 (+) Transcript_24329:171-2726(+)|eukprot:CAMPEP_0194208160 /NCGR_PEP_ID=MMETSP0156-20130528/6681_1 /TAXON_ID=33649 /ORGANISM="Thalassionema nitzschioides, Strain L26-B" /LENGTH=851 /DNA_ID=CAMNT_0038935067 /DNA_START=94 /DNA_END=2649 /DNA_ORIENTATION=+
MARKTQISYVRSIVVVFVGVVLWHAITIRSPPKSSDTDVANIGDKFKNHINSNSFQEAKITRQGVLKRDRDTFFWSLFSDAFGSNPNTPYMYVTLPLFGFLLPSPMWNLKQNDAVVLISRLPPELDYFSFTTFALWIPKTRFPFGSLGDSLNNFNIKHTDDGLFALVVTANRHTYGLIEKSLVDSGIPSNAINAMAVPSSEKYGLFEGSTHFEIVMRLLRFKNQNEGDLFLKSNHPFYYITAKHKHDSALESTGYKSRVHPEEINEKLFEDQFAKHNEETLAKVLKALDNEHNNLNPMHFAPLHIKGLDCIQENTECLGDCPDAAYFGLNIQEASDSIKTLLLPTKNEFHLVTMVNHRQSNAAIYGSIAILKSSSEFISKTHMSKHIRATSIGITSFDFPEKERFVSWVFTRNPDHCKTLKERGIHGCSIITERQASLKSYITYCERIYLNPLTGTGPDHSTILSAKLFHIKLDSKQESFPNISFSQIRLPPSQDVVTFDGNERIRLLHIIKTGGESLQNYVDNEKSPRLDFSACRSAAMSSNNLKVEPATSKVCNALATFTSSALCGLNCECCADDIMGGSFHGTLLRSPRAHVVSLFSHCHSAHHGSWSRALGDVSLYAAEGILRMTEQACGSCCDEEGDPDWQSALERRLVTPEVPPLDSEEENKGQVTVISLHNTQSHALTCSKSRGSFGQHFKRIDGSIDEYTPSIDEALNSLNNFEWFGITDLFMPSLCLLHYQTNKTIPRQCDCNSPFRVEHDKPGALGYWKENRYKRKQVSELDPRVLALIDQRTTVDSILYSSALRLFLGRLRRVEEMAGVSLLKCVNWGKLYYVTEYIPNLWTGPDGLLKP